MNNTPGRKWWDAFRNQHPDLVLRKPEGVGKERAIVRWFADFEEYLRDNNALSILEEPQRVFNADESGFSLGGKQGDMVLAERGQSHVQVYKNSAKGQVTVMVATSANGDFVPPHILLPGIPDEVDLEGKPKGAYFWNKKGWMDKEKFFSFIANVFHPFLLKKKIPLPVLLLVDGLQAHQSPEVARFCRDNEIILYRLPPPPRHPHPSTLRPLSFTFAEGLMGQSRKELPLC